MNICARKVLWSWTELSIISTLGDRDGRVEGGPGIADDGDVGTADVNTGGRTAPVDTAGGFAAEVGAGG